MITTSETRKSGIQVGVQVVSMKKRSEIQLN